MSDKLLERIATALETIAAAASKTAATPAAAAAKPATAAAAKPAAAAAKPAAAAAKPTVTVPPGKPATKPAAAKAAAAAPKTQVGKYTEDQVRAKIREVASNEALGKQEALDILDENGNVQNVSQLKPENYDKVYEACQAALNAIPGAEEPEAAAGDEFDPTA
jgi:hypothetical protein